MARFVILSLGITSCLNQCFRIAELLGRRGHRVTFVSADEHAKGPVEAQGWPFVLLAEEHALYVKKRTAPVEQLAGMRRYAQWREKRRLERAHSEAMAANRELDWVLAQLAPDLVLVDYELHGHIARVAGLGYRILLIEHHCSPLQVANVPIHSSHRIPNGRWLNTVGIRLEWWAVLLRRRFYFLVIRVYYGGADWWSTLRRIAHAYGFDWKREISRRHWQFLTYRRVPTIYASPTEFDFPHAPPNREFYVGPLISTERKEVMADEGAQNVLIEIDQRRLADGRRPLVYCAMGTISSDARYFRRVVLAFERHPEWELLLAAGPFVPLDALRPVPPNVHLLRYAPQLEVLQRADLMLTHAGPASLFECIHFGVPMVVYSSGFLEQNGNAARIEFHRLGVRGNLRKDGPEAIASRIDQVLKDPEYRRSVQAMRGSFGRYGRSEEVANLVEKRLVMSAAEMGWKVI